MRRASALATVTVVAIVLTGCGIGADSAPDPTTTTLAHGGDDGQVDGTDEGGDPFPPETPTTLDGWTARYQNLPWLSDDLDNDDYFITGAVDGLSVMGYFCGNDGDSDGYALGREGSAYAVVTFRSGEWDVSVEHGDTHISFQGTGAVSLPADPKGTHRVVPSFDGGGMRVDSTPGKSSTTYGATVDASFDVLGVPNPDVATCARESSALFEWLSAEFDL